MTENRLGLRDVDRRLLEAAKNGDATGVRKALGDGADKHARDERGNTAMCYAMEGTHADQPWPRFPEVVDVLQGRPDKKGVF
ncbi:MAG: hypothetical protein AB1295_02425 [Candidatus Micrarchaeota archaeon]